MGTLHKWEDDASAMAVAEKMREERDRAREDAVIARLTASRANAKAAAAGFLIGALNRARQQEMEAKVQLEVAKRAEAKAIEDAARWEAACLTARSDAESAKEEVVKVKEEEAQTVKLAAAKATRDALRASRNSREGHVGAAAATGLVPAAASTGVKSPNTTLREAASTEAITTTTTSTPPKQRGSLLGAPPEASMPKSPNTQLREAAASGEAVARRESTTASLADRFEASSSSAAAAVPTTPTHDLPQKEVVAASPLTASKFEQQPATKEALPEGAVPRGAVEERRQMLVGRLRSSSLPEPAQPTKPPPPRARSSWVPTREGGSSATKTAAANWEAKSTTTAVGGASSGGETRRHSTGSSIKAAAARWEAGAVEKEQHYAQKQQQLQPPRRGSAADAAVASSSSSTTTTTPSRMQQGASVAAAVVAAPIAATAALVAVPIVAAAALASAPSAAPAASAPTAAEAKAEASRQQAEKAAAEKAAKEKKEKEEEEEGGTFFGINLRKVFGGGGGNKDPAPAPAPAPAPPPAAEPSQPSSRRQSASSSSAAEALAVVKREEADAQRAANEAQKRAHELDRQREEEKAEAAKQKLTDVAAQRFGVALAKSTPRAEDIVVEQPPAVSDATAAAAVAEAPEAAAAVTPEKVRERRLSEELQRRASEEAHDEWMKERMRRFSSGANPAEAARSALNHVESSPSSALMALVGDEAPASGTTPALSLKTPVVTARPHQPTPFERRGSLDLDLGDDDDNDDGRPENVGSTLARMLSSNVAPKRPSVSTPSGTPAAGQGWWRWSKRGCCHRPERSSFCVWRQGGRALYAYDTQPAGHSRYTPRGHSAEGSEHSLC